MSGSRKRLVRGPALFVAVALVGMLGMPDAGAKPTFPSVNQPGVSATEIRVGGVATISNDPTGNTLGTSFDGVNAYFAYINATEHGVYGRKLVVDSKRDDHRGKWRSCERGVGDDVEG